MPSSRPAVELPLSRGSLPSPRPHPPRLPRASPAAWASRPQHPHRTPRPDAAPRACNIHKKHTQVGATSPGSAPRRAAPLQRLSPGRGCCPREGQGAGARGRGGRDGWAGGGVRVAPVRPGRAAPEQRGGHAPRRGVRASGSASRPPRPTVDAAEGRWPARAEGTRRGRPARPGAAGRGRPRGSARSARGAREKLR